MEAKPVMRLPPKIRTKKQIIIAMPTSSNPDFIDWKKSEAKEIILDDLKRGVLPLEEEECSAEEAWNLMYVHMPEFVTVVFEQFKDRLRDHRAQVKKQQGAANEEYLAFVHDRQLHPRRLHNRHGEPVFDLSAARPLLEEDVKNGKQNTMLPSELRQTRPEYMAFKPEVFRQRIYQEERRQKFIYYLACKRAEKQRRRGLSESDVQG